MNRVTVTCAWPLPCAIVLGAARENFPRLRRAKKVGHFRRPEDPFPSPHHFTVALGSRTESVSRLRDISINRESSHTTTSYPIMLHAQLLLTRTHVVLDSHTTRTRTRYTVHVQTITVVTRALHVHHELHGAPHARAPRAWRGAVRVGQVPLSGSASRADCSASPACVLARAPPPQPPPPIPVSMPVSVSRARPLSQSHPLSCRPSLTRRWPPLASCIRRPRSTCRSRGCWSWSAGRTSARSRSRSSRRGRSSG